MRLPPRLKPSLGYVTALETTEWHLCSPAVLQQCSRVQGCGSGLLRVQRAAVAHKGAATLQAAPLGKCGRFGNL